MKSTSDLITRFDEWSSRPYVNSVVQNERYREFAKELRDALEALLPGDEDVRERLHVKCDCVPDLGPAHCHLCSNEKESPVPWLECSAVAEVLSRGRDAEPEEWEYGVVAEAFGGDPEPHPSLEACEHVRDYTKTAYRKWTHGSNVTIHRRRKAGPWLPIEEVPGADPR